MTGRGVFLERADENDAPALAELEELCFSHPWTTRNFRETLRGSGRILILRAPGLNGGPGAILAYCASQVVLDELHIHNVAVHPEHRRRGLARWLLEFVRERARRQGVRSALLEVRASNEQALRLYRHLGFEPQSVRRNYYRHPTEDALVLRWTGAHSP
jgi:[ribosomal protein S18]-alanine N-acetyltransferase